MNRHPRASSRGISLVESAIALAVFSIFALSGFTIMRSGGSHVGQAAATAVADEAARISLGRLIDVLSEASPDAIDTTMRISSSEPGGPWESDRFEFTTLPLRQCLSPTCPAHGGIEGETKRDRLRCGLESGTWGGPNSDTVRGGIWPSSLDACPLDGSTLSNTVFMDGLRVLTSRTRSGAFTTSVESSGKAPYVGMALFFPYSENGRPVELRRYNLFIDDFVGSGFSYSTTWTRFDPSAPSFRDLLDFGTDGTRDGQPDGIIPTRLDRSDSDLDVFAVTIMSGEPWVRLEKVLTNGLTERRFRLLLRLRDGRMMLYALQREGLRVFVAGRTFTRAPTTVATGVSELAIATATSMPYDEETNPFGVSGARSIRVALASRHTANAVDGAHSADSLQVFEVSSRN